MTTNRPLHSAGSRVLRLATTVFSETTVTRVFSPAIADFREELAGCAGSRWRTLATHVRWYSALFLLFLYVPLTVPGCARAAAPVSRPGGWLVATLMSVMSIAAWPFFGAFISAAVLLCGVALACLLHVWNTRHPLMLGTCELGHDPEINLSSIHVGGDAAGLMFAAGSVAIVLIGVPGLWWFFVAGIGISLLTAWSRTVWLRHHPQQASSIVTK